MILANVLGLIDARLPGYVRQKYQDLLGRAEGLMDYQAALWNRNRNFLTIGTGTVINYGSGTGTRYKIMYRVFDYLHLKIFSFTFYNKFVEIYKFFSCKTAYYEKRQKNFQHFFLEILLFVV
jgi:hypothetical protein